MPSITIPNTFVANTVISPSQMNANFTAVTTVVNGALDNTNIAAGAGIVLTKLALAPGAAAFDKVSSGGLTWGSGLTTDTVPRVSMSSDLGIQFGPGGAGALEVTLLRSASNTLKLETVGAGAATLDMNGGTITNYVLGSPPLIVASGGTGLVTLTSGSYLKGNGTGNVALQAAPIPVSDGGTGTLLFTSGRATFATAGSIAVVDATITANSIIVVTETGTGSVDRYSVAVSAGVGFTIYSSNASSTAVVNYIRLK